MWAACEKQHLNLTWILVLFAFSKTGFFLEKKVAFSIQTGFMCLDSAFIVKAFSGSEGTLSGTGKKAQNYQRTEYLSMTGERQVQVLDLILFSCR